jgi:phage shock protein A
MPELNEITEELSRTARDAAYVVVGLGVLGLQRAQVRRQDLAKRLAEPRAQVESTLGEVRQELGRRVKDVDDRVEKAISLLEDRWEPFEERLPGQARTLIQQARNQAREARQQIRTLLPTG